jgi:membrane protein
MKSVSPLLRAVPAALVYAARRIFDESYMLISCSLAFTTMLAIVPLTLIGLGILPTFAGYHQTMEQLKTYVLKTFVPGVGNIIEQHLDLFSENASKLPIYGTIALFISAGFLLLEIRSVFHKVWSVPNVAPWKKRILELWAMLTGLPILAAGGEWLATLVVNHIGWSPGALTEITPHLVVWVVFFTMYYIFSPKEKVSMVALAIGSFVGMAVFGVAKLVFVYYITLPTLQNLVYGALAAFPLLQLWLFTFWMIVIFGAIVTERLDQATSPAA